MHTPLNGSTVPTHSCDSAVNHAASVRSETEVVKRGTEREVELKWNLGAR